MALFANVLHSRAIFCKVPWSVVHYYLTKFLETKLFALLNYQTDSEFKTPNNYFVALKSQTPNMLGCRQSQTPNIFFQSSKSQTPNMFVFPKFQTPNMYMITPIIKVNELPPGINMGECLKHRKYELPHLTAKCCTFSVFHSRKLRMRTSFI